MRNLLINCSRSQILRWHLATRFKALQRAKPMPYNQSWKFYARKLRGLARFRSNQGEQSWVECETM